MKTINFNKRILATMAIAFLCCFTAKAQDTKEWSIIPYAKIGYILDGTVSTVSLDEVYHANAGVNAKVSFNKHWSLLTGVEYNYRWGFHDASGWFSPSDHREGLRHFIRIPVCAEFTHKWFYADAGLFVERATNTQYDANETVNFSVGPEVEVGGRIRLSENDHLRIGCQSQLCVNHVTEKGQSSLHGGFFGALLTMGYEHRF
jgi:hypothetical protein